MAKEECRTAGYKLLGDYVFSEIVPDLIRAGRWDMVRATAKSTRSALELSLKEGFIEREQFQRLADYLNILESPHFRDEKAAHDAFDKFFRDYGTVIIDAVAECECRELRGKLMYYESGGKPGED